MADDATRVNKMILGTYLRLVDEDDGFLLDDADEITFDCTSGEIRRAGALDSAFWVARGDADPPNMDIDEVASSMSFECFELSLY